ncbi:restriction endonuclease [Klebsiella pneumoniae]|nr:restriction endonuclease [Klebsiella pneumoniae]
MPSSTTLQHAIENITIWRKGEQRAPHKPLLLLYVLSQYQRGHARMFDYASEIRDELHSLLERFGPQRRQYRPDMPFWRLKGDGFWGAAQQRTVLNPGQPTAARQRAGALSRRRRL